jgi:hypothetical protein
MIECAAMATVNNWASTITYQPQQLSVPQSLPELRQLISTGLGAGKKMRAVGKVYSFSFAIKEPEIVFDLQRLNQVQVFSRENQSQEPLAPGAYSDARVGGYAYVGAGTIIDAMCKALATKGLVPFSLGGSSGQSVIGATMTSTHGGDFNEFPFPEYVVGIHVLCGGQKDVWIERENPSGSYTSDADVSQITGVSPQAITIVRSTAAFNAAIVSIGCAGVVVGALMKARKDAVLNERMLSRVPWSVVKAALTSGSAFQKLPGEGTDGPLGTYRYLELLINPYVTPAEVFVVGRNELPAGSPTSPWVGRKAPDMISFALQFGLNRTSSSQAFTALINGTRLSGKANGKWQYFDYGTLINVGVPSYTPVYSYELCYPSDLMASNGQLAYLWLIDRCIAQVSKGLRLGQAYAGTIALRFCLGTSAYLGMQYSANPAAKRFAHIELSPLQAFSQQTHDLENSNRIFIDSIMASPPAQMGRLHWGQGSRPAKRHDASRAVMITEWQKQLRTLLGSHSGAFTNKFCEMSHASF